MQIKIRKIQTAIFTKNFQIADDYDRAQLLLDLKSATFDTFNGDPVLIPVPNDAPLDIPRVILNSIDKAYSCNVALNRTDVFYNVPDDSEINLNVLLQTQKNNSLKLFNFLKSKSATINRVGFVVNIDFIMVEENDKNSFDYLKEHFFKNDKLKDPKELLLRYNKLGSSPKFEMNNLITIQSRRSDIIAVQTDINTLAEIMINSDFSKDDFEEIINYSIDKSKIIIKDFPNVNL